MLREGCSVKNNTKAKTLLKFGLIMSLFVIMGFFIHVCEQKFIYGNADSEQTYTEAADLKNTDSALPSPEQLMLELNEASAEDLAQLDGIGEKLAQAIVEYRQEHGPFAAAEEIKSVSGIGDGKFERIKNNIYIKGKD